MHYACSFVMPTGVGIVTLQGTDSEFLTRSLSTRVPNNFVFQFCYFVFCLQRCEARLGSCLGTLHRLAAALQNGVHDVVFV